MKNSEQPAFTSQSPLTDYRNGLDLTGGLTKREYFAAKAMQGLLAKYGNGANPKTDSVFAVAIADALLSELESSNLQTPQQ